MSVEELPITEDIHGLHGPRAKNVDPIFAAHEAKERVLSTFLCEATSGERDYDDLLLSTLNTVDSLDGWR